MSVEELVKRLRKKQMRVHDLSGVGYIDDPECKEAADKLEELAAEVERCHARLEIDRHYVPNEAGDDFVEVSIPFHEREKFPDGIEARDATIKGQDEQLFALRKWHQEYVGKLTIAEAALAERDKEIAEAAAYAETLAVALHSQHYAENTSWRPMSGDLTGLLTQIDNMTAGLARNTGGTA